MVLFIRALKVAHRLSREAKPAAVYSSDLKRAAETARTIAIACDVSNVGWDGTMGILDGHFLGLFIMFMV